MQAKELMNILQSHNNIEKREIGIIISEHSIGITPTVPVMDVYPGFDWERNLLMVKPKEKLVLKEKNRDVKKPILVISYKNRLIYRCPKCQSIVNHKANYCEYCGQAITEEGVKIYK